MMQFMQMVSKWRDFFCLFICFFVFCYYPFSQRMNDPLLAFVGFMLNLCTCNRTVMLACQRATMVACLLVCSATVVNTLKIPKYCQLANADLKKKKTECKQSAFSGKCINSSFLHVTEKHSGLTHCLPACDSRSSWSIYIHSCSKEIKIN